MDRKDIPNFIGKHVYTTDLKATKWNRQLGLVVGWNEKRERFALKMICDGSIKLFKPFNLNYYWMPQNNKEKELVKLVTPKQLVDFEQGMELFDQLGSNEKYLHTYLKLMWFSNLFALQAKQDKRYLPKIERALENIIEISQFQDLIVWAKLLLAAIFSWTEKSERIADLCMSCVGAHCGYLPELFGLVYKHLDNVEVLKDLYFRSKHMLTNKTCNNRGVCFFQASANLLAFCRDHDPSVNIMEECAFLREALDFSESSRNCYNSRAQICMLEENYEDALRNIQIAQEKLTSDKGNVNSVSNCYRLKVNCYIKLGNKSMAQKALEKFKRFRNVADVNKEIDCLQSEIKIMLNANSTAQSEENQEVRTQTRCSFYECQKIEPQVGAFKHCGRCRLKYYCSIKCQKKHWKNGHKEECQEFEN